MNSMYPSGAITFWMCKGNLYINSLTIKNYKGFDLNTLKDILGTDYSNVVNYEPNQRDSSGNPLTTVVPSKIYPGLSGGYPGYIFRFF